MTNCLKIYLNAKRFISLAYYTTKRIEARSSTSVVKEWDYKHTNDKSYVFLFLFFIFLSISLFFLS